MRSVEVNGETISIEGRQRTQQVHDVLIAAPWLTRSEVGEVLGMSSRHVGVCLQKSWGVSFLALRKEVLKTHWKRADAPNAT